MGFSPGAWHLDIQVSKLLGRTFQGQRMLVTDSIIAFGEPQCGNKDSDFDEVIPLEFVEHVDVLDRPVPQEELEDALDRGLGIFSIVTETHSYNFGRKYCIQIDDAAEFENIVTLITSKSTEAKKRNFPKTRFQKVRHAAHELFHSFGFQVFVAILLLANFMVNAAEAQLLQDLVDENGKPTGQQATFDNLDIAFTAVFTLELLFNLLAHSLMDFFTNAWSVFDFIVVFTSIINMLSSGSSIVSVFRLFRYVRVCVSHCVF